jgi:anti-anti-sigma factor
MPPGHASFDMHEPMDGEKLAEFRSTITDSVAAGVRDVTINLDGLSRLDSGVISTLIFALRTLREHGGEVSLSVVKKSVLETLRITGLDRVFAMAA